jgi:hypothetical protein
MNRQRHPIPAAAAGSGLIERHCGSRRGGAYVFASSIIISRNENMTVTLNEAIAALERFVGFRRGRLVAVSQRLQQAGIIPTGAPRTPPRLDLAHVVCLFVAYAADAAIHLSAKSVELFETLTPGGADLSAAPKHLHLTAGDQLRAIAALAAEGDVDVRRIKLEFVSTWPELAIHWPDGSVQRFREMGALASHWGAGGHRKSISINGAALAGAFESLFGANFGVER